jgi:CubicO group peptidase (beta-lactamase class C family)
MEADRRRFIEMAALGGGALFAIAPQGRAGFGISVVTRRIDPGGPVGKFGWDGGLGTSWSSDSQEDMVTILLTQAAFTSPSPPPVVVDFWTSAYQAIDD